MKTELKPKVIIEAAIVLAAIAFILAVPAIPSPREIISTSIDKVTKSEPYTVIETQQETQAHSKTLIDWKNDSDYYYSYNYSPTFQSYFLICFSLYPAGQVKGMSSKSSYTLETAGNTRTEKMQMSIKFDDDSPFGVASDGSICIPRGGNNMQNCRLIATWDVDKSTDSNSSSYGYTSTPFVCFHNSPRSIPFSLYSNPATVKIYSPKDTLYGDNEGTLTLDLSGIDASKVWFSARVSPDDQYNVNVSVPNLCIKYYWDENVTVDKSTTKYRESTVEIPRQSSTRDYRKISLWQLIFNK